MDELTHLNEEGRARMVDIGPKDITEREAVAHAVLRMNPETLVRIQKGGIKKGDVLAVAQVAGIQGAKKTPDIIPMCHPIKITSVDIAFNYSGDDTLEIRTTVKALDKTGVEMEALSAAAVSALTVYDMCKAVDRGMSIEKIELIKKSGGKSGTYIKDWAG